MPEQFPEIPVGGIAITLQEVEAKIHAKLATLTDDQIDVRLTAVLNEARSQTTAVGMRQSLVNVVTLILSLATGKPA